MTISISITIGSRIVLLLLRTFLLALLSAVSVCYLLFASWLLPVRGLGTVTNCPPRPTDRAGDGVFRHGHWLR